jgi:hypothetical protein
MTGREQSERSPRAWRWRVRAICLILTPAIAGVSGLLWVLAVDGFRNDVDSFTLWSIVPATALAVLAPMVLARVSRHGPTGRSSARTLALAALVGSGIGMLTTILMGAVFGGMLLLFGVPVLPLWTLAPGLAMACALRVAGPAPHELRASGIDWDRLLIRSLAIGVTIVALPFAALALVSAVNRAEPELHRLPEGFAGPVVILFNDSAGSPAEYDGKRRVYRIPPSGVLRTQFGRNAGMVRDRRYVHASADGSRETRVRFDLATDSTVDPWVVRDLGYMLVGTGSSASSPPPAYRAYTISRRSEAQSLESRGQRLVMSVVYPDVR